MTWGEALRLTQELSRDPSSHVGAALAEFEYPISREGVVLMDLFDLQGGSKYGRKHKRYRRPWGDQARRTFGKTRLSKARLRAILDAHRAEVVSDA